MTLLVLSHPPYPVPISWLRPLLARLAGRDAALPERLEDWQLRDLDLTRPFPGLNRPTHFDLP